MLASPFILEKINRLIAHAVANDYDSQQRIKQLSGKLIAIHLKDCSETYYFEINDNGINLTTSCDADPDVTITGTTPDLLFKRQEKIEIQGDALLAQQFENLLKNFSYDWEQQLANIIGDVPAHQIGKRLKGLHHYGKKQQQAWQQYITDYLQEEIKLLPPRALVEDFYDQVTELSLRLERIDARINLANNSQAQS